MLKRQLLVIMVSSILALSSTIVVLTSQKSIEPAIGISLITQPVEIRIDDDKPPIIIPPPNAFRL